MRPPNQPAMRADRDADQDDDGLDHQRDRDADARPVEQAAEQVAPELVRPEDVVGRERRERSVAIGKDRLQVLDLVGPRRDQRPEDAAEQEQR